MISSKETTKNVGKAQKKTQKANKKQQQKQQQQQQQQQQLQQQQQQQQQKLTNGNKNGGIKSPTNAKTTTTNNINNNNNNIVPNNNNTTTTTGTNAINVAQKLKDQYEAERRALGTIPQSTRPPPGYENVPKMERSNSFLRNKLTKLINHITGSKENLSRSGEDEETNLKTPFTRSRSMIMLRRPNRRSFIEPQLEQLSEEAEKSGDPMSPASPRKNSLNENSEISPQLRRRADTANSMVKTPARRQSAQPFISSTPLDEMQPPASATASVDMQRKPSLMSLSQIQPSDLQLNFQKRRSNTLLASFKSTFSGLNGGSGEKKEKKDKMNPKWSASLQSLQAIDNMVSYANMSFIDYDKFNGYEKQLERQQSLMSLAEQPMPTTTQLPLPPYSHYTLPFPITIGPW
ncbi:probable serine/threonine-protein kinase MARK-A [Drosophila tropicalis]|uniref:probable serine/threonine-protein kinase MARK-A n=1 Tax=Drosophila tropicalis TaxID=46794 RepID=UPI0035AB966F